MKPVMLNGADHGHEFVEISRLADVGVDARVIAFHYVFLIVGSAENHDRDRSQGRILFARIFNLMYDLPTFQRPSACLFIGARSR